MWKSAFTGRSEKGSTTSQKKKASGTESGVSTSSRKAEDETRRSERSRGSTYDDETSVYGTAPSSRNGEPRALTESAVRLLDDDDEGWEDDDKDARSERKSVRSDGRRHRHKSEKEKSRSRSRDRKGDKRAKPSRRESGKSRGLDEGTDRAIPEMGSFEQFPGQYAGGIMGDAGQQELMMSGALSASADNQFGLARADTFGAAADYYQDEGQSVSYQPGYRAKSPNMLVNPDQHLMAATATEQPAQDTGHGSAADFFEGKVSPVPFETQSGKPARQSSGSSKLSKPGRTSSLGTAAAATAAMGAAGMTLGAAASNNSQYQSQSQYQTSSTPNWPQGSGGSMSSSKPPRKPNRQNSEPITSGSAGTYYAAPPQSTGNSGKQPSNSNAGLYAAGAAAAGAAGLAGYARHEHNQHQQQQVNGYTASSSQYDGAQYGRQPSYGPQGAPLMNGGGGGSMNAQTFHEHKGPMTRLKDGLLNLLSNEEDVVKMEMYTEYIGVCKYCFDPRTSPYDAPRVHHYHASSRTDSFEDLRRRKSIERMRRSSKEGLNRTGSNRVDKDNRYYSSDAARRRKSSDKAGLVGADLATAGVAAGANALFNNDRKDFDDTYSVKSGHRETSAVRRRSRSTSRERRRKATHGTVDRDTKEEYVTVRLKDGRVERRRVNRRSRSNSKDRTMGLAGAATGAALGASAVAASSSRHGRERSPKRSRKSRSSSREKNQQGIFGGFFSPTREEKKRRGSRTERKKKQGGFFNFGNGSVSSADEDLAFGASRTDLSLRRKSSMKSTKRKNSDEHIAATVAGIGVTAAALAAAQNGRRVKPGASGVELGAKRDVKTYPVTGPDHRHGSPGSSEEEWEDELPSDVDDATSAEGDLAFGDYDRRLSKRQSVESFESQSSGGGFLGWRWGRKDKKRRRKPSKPSTSQQGRYESSIVGSAAAVNGFDRRTRPESGITSSSSIPQRPMQEIDPRPMSEAGSLNGSRHASMPGAFDPAPPSVRPGPGPIQQPKPVTPIKPAFTESPTEIDTRDVPGPPPPRRTQSSPTQSGNFVQDAALIGAAAIGTAGIIASQGRKSKDSASNVRFGFTEEQERKHERELRREREKADDERRRADRERALKDEAARYTREQDVLRAREAENRQAAEARLETQRVAQQEAERQAEAYRQRESEQREREDAYSREQARRAEETRQQEQERVRRQREQDETERRQREQDESQRRQKEAEDQRRYEVERRQREVDNQQRDARDRESDSARNYSRREEENPKQSSVPWGAVAAGAAAAGAGAFAMREYDQRDEREKDEQREYRPRDDRVERREEYAVKEITPPADYPTQPLEDEDEDFYDPEYFRRGNRSASDYARHVELARKAASKVVAADQVFAEHEAYYQERSQSQAEFFAPEEISTRNAEGKERVADPIGDNEVDVVKSADDEHRALFERDWAVAPQPRTRYAPFGVPKLGLVSPTPPPSASSFNRRRATSPTPLAASETTESQVKSDASRTAPRRSISWGVDQTHVYDVATPEAEHDVDSYVDPRSVSATAAAAAAGVAVGAAAMHEAIDQPPTPEDRSKIVDSSGEKVQKADNSRETPPVYEAPSYETVSDVHLPRGPVDTPGTEGAPPVRGFVEGEVEEPPHKEERPHIPGGFDDDYEEPPTSTSAPEPRDISFQSMRDDRQAEERDEALARTTEPEPIESVAEEPAVDTESSKKPAFERKLSKKEKRKLEKAAKRGDTLESEEPTRPMDKTTAMEEQVGDPGRDEGLPSQGKDSKKQSFADVAGSVMTTGGIAAVAAGPNTEEGERSTGKKNGKKKGKKSREPVHDIRDDEPPQAPSVDEEAEPFTAMPGSWDTETREKEDVSPAAVVDPFQYQVHDDYQPTYPITSKSAPVTSVQEASVSPRTATHVTDGERPVNGLDRAGSYITSKSAASDEPADVATASYPERTADPSEKDINDRQRTEAPSSSPRDTRSAAFDSTAEREVPKTYEGSSSRNESGYYEEPDTYDDNRSTAASSSSRKSKRRSRGAEDDSVSVASSGSRRERDSPDSSKKDKKGGIFGGIFSRKSDQPSSTRRSDGDSLSRQSTRESRDEDDERKRHRRRHTESEYGDEDDRRSVTSESRHRHHHRRRTDENDHYPERRDTDSAERHRHRERTNREVDDREQSFLGMRVEDMPPLPDNSSVSADSATVKEEQVSGIPASAEKDTDVLSREHADAFDLIRQDAHERPAADAFDLIRHGQNERSAADAFDLVAHSEPQYEAMVLDSPDQEQDERELRPQDMKIDDLAEVSGSGPTSPTSPTQPPNIDTSQRRLSLNRRTSTTAVPLRFPFGNQPPTPSPRFDRAASIGGSMPTSPATPLSATKTRQNRPTSTEIRPLYLVERNRKTPEVEEMLPSLPSSKPSSRASSQIGSDEYESTGEDADSPLKRKPLTIDVDRAGSYRPDPDYLDSQQTTPRASEPPKPIFEKSTRQEPQFYTWEDFARDERMRSAAIMEQQGQSAGGADGPATSTSSGAHERSISAEEHFDTADLPALPPSRPESPTASERADGLGVGIPTAAVLGGTALLAHQAFEGNSDTSNAGIISRDVDKFVDSERLMEEGEVPGSPDPIEVVPSSEPNELDHFLDAEEEMEEGRMDTEPSLSRPPHDDELVLSRGAADANRFQGEIATPDLDESVEQYMQAEEWMESGHADAVKHVEEPTIEPPSLLSTVEESFTADEQHSNVPPHEDRPEERALESNAQDTEDSYPTSISGSASKLTRKQSKKSKKKQKAATRQIFDDEDNAAGEALDEPMVDSDKPETEMEAPASTSSATYQPDAEEVAFQKPSETSATEDSSTIKATDQAAESMEIDETPSGLDTAESTIKSLEEPTLESEIPQEPEESTEYVPSLSRKKSKKDKKKQRQQTKTNEDLPSSRAATIPRDIETLEASTAEETMDTSKDLSGVLEEEHELEKIASSRETRVSETLAPEDVPLPDVDESLLDDEVADPEPRGLDAHVDALPQPTPVTERADYKSLRSAFFETTEPTTRGDVVESSIAEQGDLPMPDVQSATIEPVADQVSSTHTAEDAQQLPVEDAMSNTAVSAPESRDLSQFDTSAPDGQGQEATLYEEPADEFAWTSSSKKKGKKGKKAKQSAMSTTGIQEPPPSGKLSAPLEQDRMLEELELQSTSRREDDERGMKHTSETDAAKDSLELGEQVTARDPLTAEAILQPQHDPEQSAAVDEAPVLEDDRVVENSESHVEAPVSEATDGVNGSVQKLRDAFMELGTEPEQAGAPSSSQEKDTKGTLEDDDTITSGLVNAGPDKKTSLEAATEVAAPITDEAVDGTEPMSEEQREVMAEDVASLALEDDALEAENAESFWAPQPSKKKDKKAKKSKKAAQDDTQQWEQSIPSSIDPGSTDRTPAAASTDADDNSREASAMEDIQFSMAPQKGKKGKKSKKSSLLETRRMPESAARASVPDEPLDANRDLVSEDTPAEQEAVDAQSNDQWEMPVTSRKAKKGKKGKKIAENEVVPPQQEDLEMSEEIREQDSLKEPALETSTDQRDEGLVPSSEDANDSPGRIYEDTAAREGFSEVAAASAPSPDISLSDPEPEELPSTDDTSLHPTEELSVRNLPPTDESLQPFTVSPKAENTAALAPQHAIIEELVDIEGRSGRLASPEQGPHIDEADTLRSNEGDQEMVLDEQQPPTTTEPEQIEPEQMDTEPAEQFIVKKSKKDKKKGKKSRSSTTDYWADEPSQEQSGPTEEDKGADQTPVDAAADGASLSAAMTSTEATKEEEDEWSGFPTKRSKKDKRKGKRATFDDDSSVRPIPATEQADEYGVNSNQLAEAGQSVEVPETEVQSKATPKEVAFSTEGQVDEEQDWAGISSKRSKKDKKKGKKRDSTTLAVDDNDELTAPASPPAGGYDMGPNMPVDDDQFSTSRSLRRGSDPGLEQPSETDPSNLLQQGPVSAAPGRGVPNDQDAMIEAGTSADNIPTGSALAGEDVVMADAFQSPDYGQENVTDVPDEPSRVSVTEPTAYNEYSEIPRDSIEVAEPPVQDGAANIPQDSPSKSISKGSEGMPSTEPERDFDFTATVAAGLADSGFDSNIVVNDPAFQRRASPPGTVAEADPEEFIATTTKKRKKAKKAERESQAGDVGVEDQTREVEPLTSPKSSADDLNETLEKTLAGSGFDPALIQRATSTDDGPSNEITGDAMSSYTTERRKKGKKSKGREMAKAADVMPETREDLEDEQQFKDDEPHASIEESQVEDALPSGPQEVNTRLQTDSSARETTIDEISTPVVVQPARTETHDTDADLMLTGDREMDVDEMDNAYRAFKKNKRSKKKQKAAASQAAVASRSESVSETDQREQSVQDHPYSYEPRTSSTSDSGAKALPESQEWAQTETQDVESALRPSDDLQSSPRAFNDKQEALPGSMGADFGRAVLGATVGLAAASSTYAIEQGGNVDREASGDVSRDNDLHRGLPSNERSNKGSSLPWSFASLDDEGLPLPESPILGSRDHELVRDSGYQEADSPLLQRKSVDSASSRVPEIRKSISRESLHERRSGEPLHIHPDAGSGWDIHPSKTRDTPAKVSFEALHARSPSENTSQTPVESTTKNRASYLFQTTPENLMAEPKFLDSPTPGARSGSSHHAHSRSRELSPETPREVIPDHTEDRIPSSASRDVIGSREPLGIIPEEQQGQKRTITETGIVEPDSAKAARRSQTPQSVRSRDRAFSPASLPPVTIPKGHTRSVSSPLSTDQLDSRSAWPSMDETREADNADRPIKSRTARATSSDLRSPSVMSNRSNTSGNQFRYPEELRSYSRASNRSATPTLRRTSLSGDLRAASRRGETGSAVGARASPKTIPFEAPPTPPSNDDEPIDAGASRSVNMSDVYQGYGDAEASQTSPTRPPNMRKRQSMHIMELESKLDQLAAENEALQGARRDLDFSDGGHNAEEEINVRDLKLREKDNEINQIRMMLQSMQGEISRLNEINAGLSEANRSMVDDNNGQFATLQAEHAHAHEQWQNTSRELDSVRQEHGKLTSGMREVVEAEIATALAEKNSEIRQLREDLDVATERIRSLQVQIQTTRSRDFLIVRDEDYFDGACQKLCQHVQQWVLRFSKLSDDRRCRLSTELNDDKVEARLDNVVLDGSDVDKLLGDRIKRRDVFMSVVMTMVWEYVFTRYLFGMDREQRKKLKDLEKMLEEVGPKRAVSQWRATTLTLLSQRPSHSAQRDLDTEAVASEIFSLLCRLLPPPSSGEQQLSTSLRKVVGIAVDLSIEMRCQRAEYIMLPPLQPEYDMNGDLVQKVYFNASLMNERSGTFSSNGELEQSRAVVKIVLFPLVVKKGDEVGEGEEEIVVCPAQVLVHSDTTRGKRVVRVQSGAMEIDDPRRSQNSLASPGGSMAF